MAGFERKKEKRLIAGATKRPDGSLDLSKAVQFGSADVFEAAQKSIAEQGVAAENRWKESLKIPEEARPGTSMYVWYTLRNAISVSKKQLAENTDVSNAERIRDRITSLQMQQSLLERAEARSEKSNEEKTGMTAVEANELLDALKISLQEELDEKQKDLRENPDKYKDYLDLTNERLAEKGRELKELDKLQLAFSQEAVRLGA